MDYRDRWIRIKEANFRRPYIYSFVVILLIYFILNLYVNQTYTTEDVLLGLRISFLIPYLFLNLFVALLVALSVNLAYVKFKELKEVSRRTGGLTFLGLFGGLLGGACPGCFVGLFPAFLGLFGVTASLSVLPFFGLEILVLSAVLLVISIFMLTKKTVCKIKK